MKFHDVNLFCVICDIIAVSEGLLSLPKEVVLTARRAAETISQYRELSIRQKRAKAHEQ